MLSRRAGLSATAGLSCLLLVLLKITPTQQSALFSVTIIQTFTVFTLLLENLHRPICSKLGILRIRQNESLHHSVESTL